VKSVDKKNTQLKNTTPEIMMNGFELR